MTKKTITLRIGQGELEAIDQCLRLAIESGVAHAQETLEAVRRKIQDEGAEKGTVILLTRQVQQERLLVCGEELTEAAIREKAAAAIESDDGWENTSITDCELIEASSGGRLVLRYELLT